MNIKFDNQYGYESNKRSNLGNDTLAKVIIRTEHFENYGVKDSIDFVKYIKNNYKWYVSGCGSLEELEEIQTGKFTEKDYELYIWGGTGVDGYFQITLQYNKIGFERCEQIKEELLNVLNGQFKNHHINVTFEIDHCLDKEKIENFLLNYQLDINNLPIEKFLKINCFSGSFPKISEVARNKFYEVEKQLYGILEGKNIIINGIEGKIKKVSEHATNNIHGYGFFKKRARNKFYVFGLNSIESLEVL